MVKEDFKYEGYNSAWERRGTYTLSLTIRDMFAFLAQYNEVGASEKKIHSDEKWLSRMMESEKGNIVRVERWFQSNASSLAVQEDGPEGQRAIEIFDDNGQRLSGVSMRRGLTVRRAVPPPRRIRGGGNG